MFCKCGCGKEFELLGKRKRVFYDRKCKCRYHMQLRNKRCKCCGKEFTVQKHGERYCSDECRKTISYKNIKYCFRAERQALKERNDFLELEALKRKEWTLHELISDEIKLLEDQVKMLTGIDRIIFNERIFLLNIYLTKV